MFQPSNALIRLVDEDVERFHRVQRECPRLFPRRSVLYPITFFGNIQKADVLTLALNPARTEFENCRNWSEGLNGAALCNRLMRYFDLPEAEPHRWFDNCSVALSFLGRSYCWRAAHIDLLPYPTLFQKELVPNDRATLANYASEMPRHLLRILEHCPLVKLIIVVDYTFPVLKNDRLQANHTFDFIAETNSPLAAHIKANGESPPIFHAGGIGQLPARILQHRKILRDHLQNGDSLSFE